MEEERSPLSPAVAVSVNLSLTNEPRCDEVPPKRALRHSDHLGKIQPGDLGTTGLEKVPHYTLVTTGTRPGFYSLLLFTKPARQHAEPKAAPSSARRSAACHAEQPGLSEGSRCRARDASVHRRCLGEGCLTEGG